MSKLLTPTHMEQTGKHYMGTNLKGETLTPEQIEEINKNIKEEELQKASFLIDVNKGSKNINTKNITPCGFGVLIKFYDKNPYREIETSKSGIILGFDGNATYKSNNTGEIEDSELLVRCAEVIAVGPETKFVKQGEDVYLYSRVANPIPFGRKGYHVVSEQNIYCRITEKE